MCCGALCIFGVMKKAKSYHWSWLVGCLLTGLTGMSFSKAVPPLAAVKTVRVDPAKTGAGIVLSRGQHLALRDTLARSQHKLVLMIGGTTSHPEDYQETDREFAALGFHVIGLDYPDMVVTTVCSDSPEQACFDQFRQEIVFGTPVSDLVAVDSANSIFNRFQHVLTYLVQHDPAGQWDQYLQRGQIRWDRIVVAGHSQGAGHAAYLAKHFKVQRAVLFAGPQDYLTKFRQPASWQARKSATAPNRYFAFLHQKDPFDVKRQLAGCTSLMQTPTPDSLAAQSGKAVRGKPHILMTNIETRNPHGSMFMPDFVATRSYLLGIGQP